MIVSTLSVIIYLATVINLTVNASFLSLFLEEERDCFHALRNYMSCNCY